MGNSKINQIALELWEQADADYKLMLSNYLNDPSIEYTSPFQIFGNLFYVGDKAVCSHLVNTGDGLILFDSGYPHAAKFLFDNVQSLGFRLEDIIYVIHSHEHFDHFGGTHYLQTTYKTKALISTQGADEINNYPEHTEIQSVKCSGAALFYPDKTLSDGESIKLGNTNIKAVYTPGHSIGSMSYIFNVTDGEKELTAGLCGIGGLVTLYMGRLLKYKIPLSLRDEYFPSIDKLRRENVDIALDTHPRPDSLFKRYMIQNGSGFSTNDFVNKNLWSVMLDGYEERAKTFFEREKRELNL